MIRVNDIQEKLRGLIGWQQNDDAGDFMIDEDLTQSESGVYYQQIHPLLTLRNLKCIAPDFDNTKFPDYDTGKVYRKGAIVSKDGVIYRLIAEINVSGEQRIAPGDNPEVWEAYDPFSAWLRNKTDASTIKAISSFCSNKLADVMARNLCENKVLFTGAGRTADTIANSSKLVGFEIVPVRSLGVTVKINRIGLQFTQPGVYKMYLMQSGCDSPVKELEFTKQYANTVEWFSVDDIVLPFRPEYGDAGGSWYLVYRQDELPGGAMAISKNRDWSKAPCRSCSVSDYTSWQAWSRYLELHPFYVNGVDSESDMALWDVEDNTYTYQTNYGINIEVTVACDITDFIIEQRSIFVDVIAKQLAVDMLREFAYNANVRTNRNSINASKMDILYELDGDSSSMKESGLSNQLAKAYKAINLSTKGIDRICMPCKNNGIKFRTV